MTQRESAVARTGRVAIRTTTSAVSAYCHHAHLLKRQIKQLQRGEPTADLLSLKLLRTALREVQDNLPREWSLALPEKARMTELYKALKTTSVPLHDGWEAHVEIPQRPMDLEQFFVHRAIALPIWLAERPIVITMALRESHLQTSADRQKHVEIRERQIWADIRW